MRSKWLLLVIIAALGSGCASSPHGMLYAGLGVQAPDPATGDGCERFGVIPTRVVSDERFEPHFIQPWEMERYCPTGGRRNALGCYRPDGKAFIVGRDAHIYWHEWCHAKVGPLHTT